MSYTSAFSALVIGASGYIGGAILVELRKKYPDAVITALVRSSANNDALRGAGANTIVHADTKDHAAVKDLVSNVDVVFNTADADNFELTKAVIDGLTERTKATGRRAILIHTSGAAELWDDGEGYANPTARVRSDAVEDDIASIPASALHRNVDDLVFEADRAGHLSGYIVAPSVVWGAGSGPIHRTTFINGLYVSLAQAFKRAVVIGDGSNIMATVHVDDVVSLHLLLLERGLSEKDLQASPFAKFYIASTYDQPTKDVIQVVTNFFHDKGLYPSAQLESLSLAEAVKLHPWAFVIAKNTPMKAERARAVGWKPLHVESVVPHIAEGLEPAFVQAQKQV
ncbi:NAD(P)-binding protein [Exidia glandulosa HHB12029]|uniref:NAD(P)-binding protein n=1 Tax=Exidia glandulosa HHB12029 TaxID=1314781 RepID=A0A165NYZ2_EXIGL|nr:NAD(P)-binding protein [Exidia glandulosa HHB12029]